MPVTYQTNPIIALTFVSFNGKKASFDSLMESRMTIFLYQFSIKTSDGLSELGILLANFEPAYLKNALISIAIWFQSIIAPFFWEIFHSPLFLDEFFISCVIQGLYYTFGFNFTFNFSKGNIRHRATKYALCIFGSVRYFDVTLLYILRFDFKQLFGILGNNAFKKILQFFPGIEFHRKFSWIENGWRCWH